MSVFWDGRPAGEARLLFIQCWASEGAKFPKNGRFSAMPNLTPLALSSAEKSVNVQKQKKQTVNDISTPTLPIGTVDNKLFQTTDGWNCSLDWAHRKENCIRPINNYPSVITHTKSVIPLAKEPKKKRSRKCVALLLLSNSSKVSTALWPQFASMQDHNVHLHGSEDMLSTSRLSQAISPLPHTFLTSAFHQPTTID